MFNALFAVLSIAAACSIALFTCFVMCNFIEGFVEGFGDAYRLAYNEARERGALARYNASADSDSDIPF